MSMRYIIKRAQSGDLSDLHTKLPALVEKLGRAAENLSRTIEDVISPMRRVTFRFMAIKSDNAWQWHCSSIELVGETESDLLALTETFGVDRKQLSHLIAV